MRLETFSYLHPAFPFDAWLGFSTRRFLERPRFPFLDQPVASKAAACGSSCPRLHRSAAQLLHQLVLLADGPQWSSFKSTLPGTGRSPCSTPGSRSHRAPTGSAPRPPCLPAPLGSGSWAPRHRRRRRHAPRPACLALSAKTWPSTRLGAVARLVPGLNVCKSMRINEILAQHALSLGLKIILPYRFSLRAGLDGHVCKEEHRRLREQA